MINQEKIYKKYFTAITTYMYHRRFYEIVYFVMNTDEYMYLKMQAKKIKYLTKGRSKVKT